MTPLRIYILHHVDQPRKHQEGCMITQLGKLWERQGCEVEHLYGCDREVSGDVLILHVDVSCISKAYLAFARNFQTVINLGLVDIRKRAISRSLLEYEDAYEGPVIVKTDLNCGGAPERRLGISKLSVPHKVLRKFKRWLKLKDPYSIRKPEDYLVYAYKSEVPRGVFKDRSLVVEKFLPEKHGDEYFQRRYYFCNEAEYNEIHATSVPVHATDSDDHCIRFWEEPDIPEQLRHYRSEMNADYGKIDYVVHDGQVVVFDLNRTPSCGDVHNDLVAKEWARVIAERLHVGLCRQWSDQC